MPTLRLRHPKTTRPARKRAPLRQPRLEPIPTPQKRPANFLLSTFILAPMPRRDKSLPQFMEVG